MPVLALKTEARRLANPEPGFRWRLSFRNEFGMRFGAEAPYRPMRVEAHKPVGDLMSLIRNNQEKLTYDYPTFTTRQIETRRKKICFCSLILVRLTMDKQGEFFDTTEQRQTTSSATQFRKSIGNRLSRPLHSTPIMFIPAQEKTMLTHPLGMAAAGYETSTQAFIALTRMAIESGEKFAALNLRHAHSRIEDASETLMDLMSAGDPQTYAAYVASCAQPELNRTLEQYRELRRAANAMQASITRILSASSQASDAKQYNLLK